MSSDTLRLLKDHVRRLDSPDIEGEAVLPQCHWEEVNWFTRFAEGIKAESSTITPEEFQEFLGLMPRIFPGLTQGAHQILRTPKGIVLKAPLNLPQEAQDQICTSIDKVTEIVTTNIPVEIVALPEGVQLLLVSAPGAPDKELMRLYEMFREGSRDPDFAIITNYHITISGSCKVDGTYNGAAIIQE